MWLENMEEDMDYKNPLIIKFTDKTVESYESNLMNLISIQPNRGSYSNVICIEQLKSLRIWLHRTDLWPGCPRLPTSIPVKTFDICSSEGVVLWHSPDTCDHMWFNKQIYQLNARLMRVKFYAPSNQEIIDKYQSFESNDVNTPSRCVRNL